jgi:hypothetical protein
MHFGQSAGSGWLKSFAVECEPALTKSVGYHFPDSFAHERVYFRGRSMWSIDPHAQKHFHRTVQILLVTRTHHGGELRSDPGIMKFVTAQAW